MRNGFIWVALVSGALLLSGCSRTHEELKPGEIAWNGSDWVSGAGTVVDFSAEAAQKTLRVKGPAGVGISDCRPWLEPLMAGRWQSVSVNGGPLIVCREFDYGDKLSTAIQEMPRLVFECIGGEIWVLGHEVAAGCAKLPKGSELLQLRKELGNASVSEWCLVIVRSGEEMGSMEAVLRVASSIGVKEFSFLLDPEFSVLTPVVMDPDVKPPIAGDEGFGEGIPIFVAEDGSFFLGEEEISEDELELLCQHWSAEHEDASIRLYGMGDSMFRHSRRAIRVAAAGGISRVKFHDHQDPGKECHECLVGTGPALEMLAAIRAGDADEVEAPQEEPAIPTDPTQPEVLIRIKEDGTIEAQMMEQSLESLAESFREMTQIGVTPLVRLQAAENVPQKQVLEVIMVLQEAGIEKVTMAVEP